MLLTALIFGLLGSFHCVGMCGPIAFMLPVHKSKGMQRVLQIASYHGGRLLTYGILGLLFGLLGQRLQLFGLQQWLSIVMGILMVGVILMPSKLFARFNGSRFAYKWVGKIKSALSAELGKKTIDGFFTIGFLNGFLP